MVTVPSYSDTLLGARSWHFLKHRFPSLVKQVLYKTKVRYRTKVMLSQHYCLWTAGCQGSCLPTLSVSPTLVTHFSLVIKITSPLARVRAGAWDRYHQNSKLIQSKALPERGGILPGYPAGAGLLGDPLTWAWAGCAYTCTSHAAPGLAQDLGGWCQLGAIFASTEPCGCLGCFVLGVRRAE